MVDPSFVLTEKRIRKITIDKYYFKYSISRLHFFMAWNCFINHHHLSASSAPTQALSSAPTQASFRERAHLGTLSSTPTWALSSAPTQASFGSAPTRASFRE